MFLKLITISLICLASQAFAAEEATLKKDKELCKKDSLGACLRVAEHFNRVGSMSEAAKWYEIPCVAGDEASCLKLGEYYKAAAIDPEALKWFRMSCNAPTSSGLGCYEVAKLAEKSNSKGNAAHWKKKACAKGHKPAC